MKKTAPAKKAPRKAAKKAANRGKPAAPRGRIGSEADLAKFLTVSRSTISRLKRKPDCPAAAADGTYSAAEWKEFYEANRGNFGAEDEDAVLERRAKRQMAEVKLERELLELEVERGKYLGADETCEVLTQAFGAMVAALKDSEHTMAPVVAGLDVPEAKALIRKTYIDALMRFSVGDWAQKKTFFRTVSATLRDLQETLSRGNGLSAS